MRIPPDALIAEDKLVRYLFVWRPADDKSQFLAQAGFTLDSPESLRPALRALAACALATLTEAVCDEDNEYGEFYRVEGDIVGPTGRALAVTTIWLRVRADGGFRFITLKPRKGKGTWE